MMCGENHTSLYGMANGVYVINEEHYRPDVDSRTLGCEVIGTEGALAMDRADEEMLTHSRNPFLNPATVNWTPMPLTAEERTLLGFACSNPVAGNTADLRVVGEWVKARPHDEGRDLIVNADVGAATMEMIHGAYASHAEGRRVTPPLADRGHTLEQWLDQEGRSLPQRRPSNERYDTWVPWALAQSRVSVPPAAWCRRRCSTGRPQTQLEGAR